MARLERQVRKVLARHPADRSELIPILQEVQDKIGYLPREALRMVAEYLNVPDASVFGVATFYAQFYLEPQGRHRIRVCRGTACHVRGSGRIRQMVERKLGVKEGETTPDMLFTYETVACLGACALSPVMVIDGTYYGRMTAEKAEATLDEYLQQAKKG